MIRYDRRKKYIVNSRSMKTLKKISLAYALQVFGVIMLFGYPGCSSNIKEQKVEQGENDIAARKHAIVKDVKKKPQTSSTSLAWQQPGVKITLASYLNFSK